ncbi:MAG: pentapeptide repeat-containing protein [Xenococcaceae cyanobacterium]
MDDSRKNGNATSSSQKGNDYNHNISFPHRPNFRKLTKPKRWSSIRNTTLVDWIKILSTAMIAGLITLWINESQSSLEAKRYHQRLVREYIDSVKVLLLDEYHHEEYKKPEILPTDVEDFVKSKTATTIKALKDSPEQRERLINFLRRVGVGFATLNRNFQEIPQDICDRPVTTTKNKEYSHFLCQINLDGADLRKDRLITAILQDAKLDNAKLRETVLDNSLLQYAFLQTAQMQKASLIKADLTEANLTEANLTGADLTEANLTKANLTKANLTDANLTDANLTDADLTKALLSFDKAKDERGFAAHSADLTDADLTDADLTGANLTKADLRGATLQNTRISHQTKLKDALFGSSNDSSTQLKVIKRVVNKDRAIDIDEETAINQYKMLRIAPNADLRGADLRGADLRGDDLTKADLRGADLRYANFRGADLTGARVDDKTKLKDALFDSSNDSSTQLPFDQDKAKTKYKMLEIVPNANLTKANLEDEEDEATNLRDAKLIGVDLKGADLTGADLTGADLTGADLTKADLRDAKLNGIRFDRKTKLKDALLTLSNDSSTQLPFDQDKAKEYEMRKIDSCDSCNDGAYDDLNLRGADLRDANLKLANLTGVDLTGADLTDANLELANLTGADLTGADLKGADLTDANFTNATITNAQLASAKLCRTINYNGTILAKFCEVCLGTSEQTFPPRQSMESQ